MAVVDDSAGTGPVWCDFLIANHYECTVLPQTGPSGSVEEFDVLIDLSNTWSDPDGLLADHLRAGKGVITVDDAVFALGIESDSTVQDWIGANAAGWTSWASLSTTDSDEALGALPVGTPVGFCHQLEQCVVLSDTSGHPNAKILADYFASGAVGILRNTWEGGQSVFLSGGLKLAPPDASQILFRAVGLLSSFPEGCFDLDLDNIPDACCFPSSQPRLETVQGPSGFTDALLNNRYISLQAGDAGRVQAIRVRLVWLPPPYDVWTDTTMWVGQPRQVSENGASVEHTPGFADSNAATLVCEPFYTDWSVLGTVNVFHEAVVPQGAYRIDVVDESCAGETDVASSLLHSNARPWGDIVGVFDEANQVWSAANAIVDILDITAVVQKFISAPSAPAKARCDLYPACPDLKIDITDVLFGVTGFQGLPYPFAPSTGDPCDSPCTFASP